MHPLLKAGGRALALRLDRLRETIRTAAARLRDSIARLLGDTLTDTLRDVIHTVLDHRVPFAPVGYPPIYRGDRYVPSAYRRSYDDDDALASWMRQDDSGWVDPDAAYEEPDDVAPTPSPAANERPAWSVATEVGLRASAWWLRRGLGSRTLLAGLAAGGVVASLALLGGTWALAGLRLTDLLSLLAT